MNTDQYKPLQVGKWYAEIEDDGAAGVLYQCVDKFIDDRGVDTYVMADESEDSESRYISGRSATTEFWIPQL